MTDTRKTVFITGYVKKAHIHHSLKLTIGFRCSGIGIGNRLARTFHDQGYRVFATARKADSLNDLATKGIDVMSLTVDDHQSVISCFEDLRQRLHGRGLDYLINNAGRSIVPTNSLPSF